MANSFKQTTTGTLGIFSSVYLWSNAANWSGGIPGNGSSINFDIPLADGHPSGIDDIAGLSLASAEIKNGYLAVAASLTINSLTVFGSTSNIYSDTLAGTGAATLTINNLAGTGSSIGAVGSGAVTNLSGSTDPGDVYYADNSGEIILAAAPNASSTLSYDDPSSAGTIALRSVGSTVSAALSGVQVGDALALPVSAVEAVIFGTSSITIQTNTGTIDFSNVSYGSAKPTTYILGTDAVTGEQMITFAIPDSFSRTSSSSFGSDSGVYLWSKSANWNGGVPVSGASVNFAISLAAGEPSGIDDIAGLSVSSLALQSGYLAVAANLTIGNLAVSGTSSSIFTNTVAGTGAATLTINNLSGSNASIGAVGTGALTNVLATTDPGELYYAEGSGEVILAAAPSNSSTLSFADPLSAGTIAFRKVGQVVDAQLSGLEVGDSLVLPGSNITTVVFSSNNIVVSIDGLFINFNNVSYGETTPNGYTVSTDAATGELKITFSCFLSGTRIKTPSGWVAVEDLRPDDLVVTATTGAAKPIKWIGHRSMDAAHRHHHPIRIRAHSFGEHLPSRDLFVSPDHAVFTDGVLVPAMFLENGFSITRVECSEITYFHILLETHDVIIAEGLATESLQVNGDMAEFDNDDTAPAVLGPMAPCAPRITQGPRLAAIRERMDRLALETA